VAYRGTAPALNDLIGGHVDFFCEQVVSVAPQIAAGTIKAYATLALGRDRPAELGELRRHPGIIQGCVKRSRQLVDDRLRRSSADAPRRANREGGGARLSDEHLGRDLCAQRDARQRNSAGS